MSLCQARPLSYCPLEATFCKYKRGICCPFSNKLDDCTLCECMDPGDEDRLCSDGEYFPVEGDGDVSKKKVTFDKCRLHWTQEEFADALTWDTRPIVTGVSMKDIAMAPGVVCTPFSYTRL